MDYAAQKSFLNISRLWATFLAVALLLASAWPPLLYLGSASILAIYALILLSTAASLTYTPSYLHLTVYPTKRRRWAVRVRWPILAAALLLALPFCHSRRSFIALLAALTYLAFANFLASRPAQAYATWLLSGIDYQVIFALFAFGNLNPLIGAALFVAATHLFVVATEKRPYASALLASFTVFCAIMTSIFFQVTGFGGTLKPPAVLPPAQVLFSERLTVVLILPVLVSAFATAFLVRRAQRRNRQNLAPVMAGLVEFTGYTPEHIRHLMTISDAELASKWKQAGIAPDDAPRMAQRYQENSELYLFALVSFNLDYKRIRYYLTILPLAHGTCLDYGAGNGELLIEIARRGHPVTYYDVDGLTMQYARHRAKAENLSIQFFTDKQALAQSAPLGFDTIFSLDVLEHLPDLPGELAFLSSILSPAGAFIFNLPPGSTKSHPMHLDHNLDVRAFLTHRSLVEDTRSHHRKAGAAGKDDLYMFRRC